MSDWGRTTIGDVSLRVTKGTTPKMGGFTQHGVSFVKVESITGEGHINPAKLAYINEETNQLLARSILKADDLLFSIAGTIGRVARVAPALLPANTNQALAIIRPDQSKVDVGFLLYCLRDKDRIQEALSLVVQSVQANLSLSELSAIEIPLPPMSVQRAIAEVLGALDDRILANTKLAETAAGLATAEFRLRVRHLPFSDQSFADLSKVSGGGTPSTSVPEFWNGDVRWATPTDVTGLQGPYLSATSRRISEAGLNSCASELYPGGSILMTSRATIGAFALSQEPMAVNQGFIVVQPNDPDLRYWFFHEMQSRVDEFISLANGATFLELSRGNFKKFKVRLAEPHVMKEFVALAEPLHAAAANALSENTKLANTRDLLLPQLMSGKLRVKDAVEVLETAGV